MVIQNPRPYNVVTFFTVRTGCDECLKVYSELKGAAYSYAQAVDSLEVPTFFAALYYSSNEKVKKIFSAHNFKTIPYLATSEMVQKRPEGDFYGEEDLWKIKSDDAYETQQLLDFVNKRFVNDVPLKMPLHVVFLKNLSLFVVLVVLIRVFVSVQDLLVN